MRQLLAIIKLTLLSTIRSYVFQTLLVLLIAFAVCLPMILTGDGTPVNHFKLSLDYTISTIAAILVISTLWLTCTTMTFDLDKYQMHVVTTKPVSRTTVWFGKFLGVLSVHTIMLLAAMTAFYFYMQYDLYNSNYSEDNINLIQQNILTGRKTIRPDLNFIKTAFNKSWKQKQNTLKKQNKPLSKTEKEKLRLTVYYQTMAQSGQVEPQKSKAFIYNKLNSSDNQKIILKFRLFAGELDTSAKQIKSKIPGTWKAYNFSNSKYESLPEEKNSFSSNVFHEIQIPGKYVSQAGSLKLKFKNNYPSKSIFFQLAESPNILVTQSSFLGNYLKGIIIIFLLLIFITGIGCAFGSIFSFPIAVFSLIAYLIVGSIANFLIHSEPAGITIKSKTSFSTNISQNFLNFIVPIEKFSVSKKISSGMLISTNEICRLILFYLILRELPFVLICVFIYSKRELGLIIKK